MGNCGKVLMLAIFAVFAVMAVNRVYGQHVMDVFSQFTPQPSSEAARRASNGVGSIFDTVVTTSIRNNLDTGITNIRSYQYYGKCVSPLPSVIKSDSEAILVSHKSEFMSCHGAGGLYSFDIEGDGVTLMAVVIYSSPHPLGRALSKPWFGLAFMDDKSSSLESIYNYLYAHEGWNSAIVNKMFACAKENRTLSITKGSVQVTASMMELRWPILQVDVADIKF